MDRSLKEFIYFNKKGIISFILVLIVLGGGITAFIITSPKSKVEAEEEIILEDQDKKAENKKVEKEDKKEECFFDIKGKVKKEGVYKLDCNSRVIDAINLAGGPMSDADTSIINLSKKITDSMVIKVYSKTEVKNYLKTLEEDNKKQELCLNDQVKNNACINNNNSNNNSISNKLVNINTASLEELMTLDGIGEAKANAIIKYRSKTPFKSIEEITNIEGLLNLFYYLNHSIY